MRKIIDIYEQYNIMPDLQLHQLRVAAVAIQICDSLDVEIDKESVIAACLLHDMGNIIKSDLEYFPDFTKVKGIEYWQNIKEEFVKKYGHNTGIATSKITKELGVSGTIQKLVEHNDFKYICDIAQSDFLEKKIIKYSDLRVGPYGVISLDERFIDIVRRYKGLLRNDKKDCAENIEKQIFSHPKIKPEDINDQSVVLIIEKLKNFEI